MRLYNTAITTDLVSWTRFSLFQNTTTDLHGGKNSSFEHMFWRSDGEAYIV